jgi:ABC-type dipeptide/oligopeptide/nickel transport system permease subunit
MLSQTFYAFAFAILVEVTLVYLNLIYPQPNQGSWGEMLVAGKKALANYEYWLILFPSAAILLTLSAYYLLGAGLQKQIEHHGAT